MKAKNKPVGIKHNVHKKKREKRIGLAVIVAILIAIVLISGFLINSMLNQPSTSQPVNSTAEPKAAIVDQLSLTCPNQTFIETATNILKQAGYTVDYYSGEKVTVEFYRNLPTRNYALIILRVHSTAAALEGEEFVETGVSFFTSESYSQFKYVWEQLTDQLAIASYTMPEPPYYFAIFPKFVTSSMKGKFQNSTIIMMGCEGLNNTKMAEAFIQKGAKAYISWSQSVSADHTDIATANLLQHMLIQKQTIEQAVENTMKEIGPDPTDNSFLLYYPTEVGKETIEDAS